jgi:hypothetical protein
MPAAIWRESLQKGSYDVPKLYIASEEEGCSTLYMSNEVTTTITPTTEMKQADTPVTYLSHTNFPFLSSLGRNTWISCYKR